MKRICAVFCLVVLISAGIPALTWTDWSLDAGFGVQINSQLDDTAQGKQPSKFFFVPGASFHLNFDGEGAGGYFRPGFFISWGIEEVYNGIARPTDEATLDHMKVLGLMMDFPFGYAFQAGNLEIGIQGGPAFYARFPLYTAQLGTAEPSEFWTAYYGAAQFLYASLVSWVSIPMRDEIGGYSGNDLLVGLRYYQPLSNLWTEAPFGHGIQLGLLVSFRFGVSPEANNSPGTTAP